MGQRASGCHIKVDALAPNVARIHRSGHPDFAAKSKKSDMETGLTNHHRPLMPTFSSFYFFLSFIFPAEFDIDSGRDPIVSGDASCIGLRYMNICIRIRGSVRSGSGLSPEGSNFSKLIKSSFD